ncbi:MAG: response regulator transcription factor [bacterium]
MQSSRKQRVLIIEDEPDLVRGLTDALGFEGFDVASALDGDGGLRSARSQPPDCVVLDLMLPDRNGFAVCGELRRLLPRVPILILSARSQESDIIRGLEAGADDYVTKPFGVAELIARMQALLRLVQRQAVSSPHGPILIGKAAVDLSAQLVAIGRKRETLTFYEAECLKILHGRAGRVVSREELLKHVWGAEGAPSSRTVDNVVVKLRRKLQDDAKHPQHILTVYGTGYKLVL